MDIEIAIFKDNLKSIKQMLRDSLEHELYVMACQIATSIYKAIDNNFEYLKNTFGVEYANKHLGKELRL